MKWSFNYIAISNNPAQAIILDSVGVQQIMVDAEINGKHERQGSKNTIISDHQISDIKAIKKLNLSAEILCRINPYYAGTENEINEAIDLGVDRIMIPMIASLDDFKKVVEIVDNRCRVIPLIETPYSLFKINDIIAISEINQIHFGLNDLYLAMGMKNLFEILLSPVFGYTIKYTAERCELVGFGGVGDPLQPQTVDPGLIIQEHLKMGSKSVILSRSFFKAGYDENNILSSLEALENIIRTGVELENNNKLKSAIDNF